jgi:hypothetical protein
MEGNMKLWYKIALPAMAVGILLAWSTLPGCNMADHDKAVSAAKKYAKNVPDATGNVDCVAKDSDGDGYVSCTIFRKEGDPVAVECGAEKWCGCNCAEGCKAAQPKIKGSR